MKDLPVERARGRGPRSLLVALFASALVAIAPCPARDAAAQEGSGDEPPRGRPPRESVLEATEPPEPPAEALGALPRNPDEPPELTELKARLVRGEGSTGSGDIKLLQKLSHKHPQSAEIVYLLGQLYLAKLWVGDGLKALRRAVELEPLLRANPFLIRAAINGLGNDRDQAQVRRFLISEIGRPAAPYLEEVLHGEWRAQVKERAANILAEINQAAP
ncbi:MAG: hypothetical protein U1A78_07830 [Polyangia bacterium]